MTAASDVAYATHGNQAAAAAPGGGTAGDAAPPDPPISRRIYLRLLAWTFLFFNSVRCLAYLPTAFSIHASGDSSQHSLFTWLIWLGANASMGAWLYENEGRRVNRAILVSMGNAAMCLGITVQILYYRF